MKLQEKILRAAKETISIEAKAIANLEYLLDNEFFLAVEKIYNSRGRLVVTGIDENAIVANKIVATLNSVGIHALFIQADATYRNSGSIQKEDVVICISERTNGPEIKLLVSYIKSFGNLIIGVTGDRTSFLGRNADFVINAFVEKEASINNPGRITTTTAQMIIGDALATCLLELKGFSNHDLTEYHPGAAREKMYLKLGNNTTQNMNAVNDETSVSDVGIRCMLKKTRGFNGFTVCDGPKTIAQDSLAVDTFELLEKTKFHNSWLLNRIISRSSIY